MRVCPSCGEVLQFRPVEGIVRDGDFDFHYCNGKRYRMKVSIELEEEK